MPENDLFAELVRRIRRGDQQAAVELVRQYEPVIRAEVRFRLTDTRLNRLFDSMDICQSVLASFFVRAAAGQFDLDRPEQLLNILMTMARNKLASQARKQHRQRRDNRRVDNTGLEKLDLAASETSPERVVEGQELYYALRGRLSDEERQLADLRGEGHNWQEIAARMGGTPEGRRKQLSRAANRVAQELGLDEDIDD
jgi:RNA polymerase sigma-70 factor (ECF subfamily)